MREGSHGMAPCGSQEALTFLIAKWLIHTTELLGIRPHPSLITCVIQSHGTGPSGSQEELVVQEVHWPIRTTALIGFLLLRHYLLVV